MPRARKAAQLVDQELPGLDDAAALGQDPTPGARARKTPAKRTARGSIGTRTPSGRIASKAQMIAQVHDELYGLASMLVGIIGIKDDCVDVLTEPVMTGGGEKERLEAIVAQTVKMIARNDKLLTVLASGGVIFEAGILGSLLVPVGKRIWEHHGPNGDHHRSEEDQAAYVDRYPAPALARG